MEQAGRSVLPEWERNALDKAKLRMTFLLEAASTGDNPSIEYRLAQVVIRDLDVRGTNVSQLRGYLRRKLGPIFSRNPISLRYIEAYGRVMRELSRAHWHRMVFVARDNLVSLVDLRDLYDMLLANATGYDADTPNGETTSISRHLH